MSTTKAAAAVDARLRVLKNKTISHCDFLDCDLISTITSRTGDGYSNSGLKMFTSELKTRSVRLFRLND